MHARWTLQSSLRSMLRGAWPWRHVREIQGDEWDDADSSVHIQARAALPIAFAACGSRRMRLTSTVKVYLLPPPGSSSPFSACTVGSDIVRHSRSKMDLAAWEGGEEANVRVDGVQRMRNRNDYTRARALLQRHIIPSPCCALLWVEGKRVRCSCAEGSPCTSRDPSQVQLPEPPSCGRLQHQGRRGGRVSSEGRGPWEKTLPPLQP